MFLEEVFINDASISSGTFDHLPLCSDGLVARFGSNCREGPRLWLGPCSMSKFWGPRRVF